jgi:NAD(P)H-dependent flavin oxidoreductase YrpB (nitropropane dioxygenase family)
MQALFTGDMTVFPAMAGQGCGLIRDVRPAADVVRSVVSEAEAALRRLAALV